MKRVAMLLFPGVQALDVAGPLDVFAEANAFVAPGSGYQVLTLAERGLGRQTTAALMARLLRVAAMFPRSVDDTLMWQVTDLVTGDDVSDTVKLTLIRMGWASIVQAQYKVHGLRMVAISKRPQAAAA